MTPVDLLLRLQELDVKVVLDGDKLQLSTSLDSLPPDVRDAVAAQESALVTFLRAASSATKTGSSAGIQPVPRTADLQLSFAQQRIWFLLQLGEDASAYTLLYVLDLHGALDPAAVEWSLGEIVARHEALRSHFEVVDGDPVQVIEESVSWELARLDLSARDDAEPEVLRLAKEELSREFDPTVPFRFTLAKLGPDRHVLLLAMLHSVSDGWSYGVLFRELAQLYEAKLAGAASPLPPLKVQYADYAAWQRAKYEADSDTLLAYWRPQLDGAPILELPTDRPRPTQQTFGGRRRFFPLSESTQDSIRALSKAEGCTYFMAMLAVFDVLLARYSNQDDIVVGTPVANRERVETEPIIGLFLNTLVLRSDLSGNPTFREVLGRVREMALDAFAHQDMPFEQLVVELRPERDLSRNPLFQVQFNILYESEPPSLGDLRVELVQPEIVTSQFDLSLILSSTGGTFEYNTDLFDDETILRLEQHFARLLAEVADNPDRSIWEIPLMMDDEKQRLLIDVNRTVRDYPSDRCFHQLFEAQVERTPDAVAVVHGDQSLTYSELNARANQLAHNLRGLGARPDKLIGISVERSPLTLVGLLGILKSGAAYVPLDPAYPADRLAFVMEDAGIELLVTQESLRGDLPEQLPTLVRLDADADAIAEQSGDNPVTESSADNLAYVIFTSGSTGRPKGVQIEHRALVNFLTTMAERPGLTADDVLVAVTTISFDIAGLELYLPLLVGGRVVIASDGAESDGRQLAELLEQSAATVMQATPATWHLLLESGWPGHPEFKALCGGEALPRELAEQLLSKCGQLWNMYGPTETTIWSLVDRVTSGSGQVPIGDPIANTTVFLLDRHGQAVVTGVAGELHIGGAGLARGYWRRPELTDEKFITHPLAGDNGARLYNTGDLARRLADGRLEFLGRVDHQVKVRGFRIELGEIEHVLSAHEVVKECVVVAQTRRTGDAQLAAHVVLLPGTTATVSELRRSVRDKLPDYMVPPAFVILDQLPLTPNGKIDRKALSQAHAARAGTEKFEPPKSEMEKFLADVWQELLDLDRVGIHDNFFDLGGHSLLAMKVAFRVEEKIGERVMPMEMLLQNLHQFAQMCERRRSDSSAARAAAGTEGRTPAPAASTGVFGRLKRRLGRTKP